HAAPGARFHGDADRARGLGPRSPHADHRRPQEQAGGERGGALVRVSAPPMAAELPAAPPAKLFLGRLEEAVLDLVAGLEAQPLGGTTSELEAGRDVTLGGDDVLRQR